MKVLVIIMLNTSFKHISENTVTPYVTMNFEDAVT